MNRLLHLTVASILASAWGCSSSSGHPIIFEPTDTGADTATDATGDVAPDAIGDTTTDALKPDGDAGDSTPGDAVVAACPKGYADVPPVAVVHPSTSDTDLLAAMTWDERTMVWTSQTAGVVTVHYSDRAGRNDPFVADLTLPASLGPFSEDKLALSADGLTLMVGSADHRQVRQLTRTARGTAFDAASATSAPFARLTGNDTTGVARELSDLTLSSDGKWLFYTDLKKTSGPSLMVSTALGDGTWNDPTPINAARLQIDGTFYRHPTGLSADGLSLFYFDDTSRNLFVAFHPASSLAFNEFYAYVPAGRRAMPAASCDRVYLTIETLAEPLDGGIDDGGKLESGPADAPTPALVRSIVHAP